MMVCDIAEVRERKLDTVVRVSLEQMGKALQVEDAGLFPFAVRMAKISTHLDGRQRVLDGVLFHRGVLAEIITGHADRNDAEWHREIALRAAEARGLRCGGFKCQPDLAV